MACRTREIWLGVSLKIAILLLALPGCGRTDLKGYRPAREHSAEVVSNKTPGLLEADNASAASINASPAESAPEAPGKEFDVLPVSALVPVNVIDGANV